MVKTLRYVKARLTQGFGKVRRFTYGRIRKKALQQKIHLRRGECLRCGACCRLLFKCPLLIENPDGSTSCRIHNRRPDNCRFFPLDPRDIQERNIQMPLYPCGYTFTGDNHPKAF